MRKLSAAVLILAVAMTAVLLITPLSSAATDTVKIYYQDTKDIQVEFPNGKVISKGGELIIVTSSQVYDMDKSGMMFYKYDPETGPIWTSSMTPDYRSFAEDGNIVTHYFYNLKSDIEMSFSDLKELGSQANGNDSKEDGLAGVAIEPTTIIMLAALALGIVMLAVTTGAIRRIEPNSKESGGRS